MSSCFGTRGYEHIPEDSGSTLPSSASASASASVSTTESIPSTESAAAAAASTTTALKAAETAAAAAAAAAGTQKREKSSERRGRRSNNEAPFGHHGHTQIGHHKDTVLCPTCRGQGKVPKEKEGHLVALIPADDERLQPSKTKTYVFIAVVVSLVLAFLTIFFIYPRSFNLQTNKKEPDLFPIGLYINTTEQVVRFRIRNWWFLQNPNYYPIHLTNLNVQAYMNKLVSESSNVSVVTIPLRSKVKIYATLQITFKDDLSYLVKFCNDDRSWVHTIFIRFQATAIVNIMGYNFTSIAETYQKVSCGRDKSTTVAPITTATTTLSTTSTTSKTTTTTPPTTTTTPSPATAITIPPQAKAGIEATAGPVTKLPS